MKFGSSLTKLAMGALAVLSFLAGTSATTQAQSTRKPNILVIMGDDVGWFNIGAYQQGMMSGKTPNLDKRCPGHALH